MLVCLYVYYSVREREGVCNSRCSLWSCRHASMLLPSGWLSRAERTMVVAVKSLADGKAQGLNPLKTDSKDRER